MTYSYILNGDGQTSNGFEYSNPFPKRFSHAEHEVKFGRTFHTNSGSRIRVQQNSCSCALRAARVLLSHNMNKMNNQPSNNAPPVVLVDRNLFFIVGRSITNEDAIRLLPTDQMNDAAAVAEMKLKMTAAKKSFVRTAMQHIQSSIGLAAFRIGIKNPTTGVNIQSYNEIIVAAAHPVGNMLACDALPNIAHQVEHAFTAGSPLPLREAYGNLVLMQIGLGFKPTTAANTRRASGAQSLYSRLVSDNRKNFQAKLNRHRQKMAQVHRTLLSVDPALPPIPDPEVEEEVPPLAPSPPRPNPIPEAAPAAAPRPNPIPEAAPEAAPLPPNIVIPQEQPIADEVPEEPAVDEPLALADNPAPVVSDS